MAQFETSFASKVNSYTVTSKIQSLVGEYYTISIRHLILSVNYNKNKNNDSICRIPVP